MTTRIKWPNNKSFAFTVFDDADRDQLHNTKPVYDFLHDLGIRTTKSAWLFSGNESAALGGLSCDTPYYLDWIKSLQRNGFEIGYHNARFHSSLREDTVKAIDRFKELFGHDPRSMSNHFQNKEGIYWGSARLSGMAKLLYTASNLHRRKSLQYEGHKPGSPYFWGDICKDRIGYVRNFVYREINTLKACPFQPYYDPQLPYVNNWYASAEGGHVGSFVEMLTESNQDQLAEEGGACIMYTHFAKDFYKDGSLQPRFKELMKRLAAMNGWFVPVADLLDYLRSVRGKDHVITSSERRALERRWLSNKLRHGSS
jgi:hypothetical protein